MNYLAESIDSIFEYEANLEDQLDCEIFEVDFRHGDALAEVFDEEIDAWANDRVASGRFGDY